jgi:ribosome biogenesis GTPase A
MLTNKKGLAMTSSKPGKTLLINHFLINNNWHLVDLPGYGYATAGKKMREQLQNIIESYILYREQLTCLFLLIDKLEHFLLELGTGFTFVARQNRISFDDKHFRIDLVFYNRILRCFVLIDLKVGELKHQDIGQMQMYVNYYDRKVKLEDENKTIGIILCQNKSEAVVEFTLPENNTQIFASKYLTVLPSKETLIKLIENEDAESNIS